MKKLPGRTRSANTKAMLKTKPRFSWSILDMRRTIIAGLFAREAIAAVLFGLALVLFEPLILPISYRWYLINFQNHQYAFAFGAMLVIFVSIAWAMIFFWASFTSTPAIRIVYF